MTQFLTVFTRATCAKQPYRIAPLHGRFPLYPKRERLDLGYKDGWRMTTLADLYRIDNYNDTFALGHYARVLDALDKRKGHAVAFKVLRPEHMAQDNEPR